MRRVLAGIGITLLLLLPGCDFKEIDLRIFVLAIGVDEGTEEGNFKISLKLAIPQGDVTKIDEKMQILTEESSSISEALRRMKSRVEKELDYSHCKSIILGEEVARKDILHVMDWAVRRRDIQLIINFAIGRPEALQVLKVRPESERIPSNSLILAMSGQGTESPFISSVYSYQLMRNVFEEGIDPILPIIETKGEKEFLIDKIALLNNEKIKMVLTPNETRLYNLLSRPNLRTNLPAHSEGIMFQYYTERSSSHYKIVTPEQGKATIRYHIKIKGILEESSSPDLVTHSMLEKIAVAGGKELEVDILALLTKIQASGLDPFGWGLHYGARHFNNDTEMKVWKELYSKLDFQVKADVDIKYSGMIR
ncbi:Ger(x)C family spore germination protein [Paenibacillus sp. FSL P4-0502]|uniref:Ger(x)C family spore germination protein n=1 Tax=Paenibacillus sp. FSL P4-0502 TaxID=2975319 RepID=UPI0030FCBCB0